MQSDAIIRLALREDIGSGDITTEYLIDENAAGSAMIIAKEPLVVAGTEVALRVFQLLDREVDGRVCVTDGSDAAAGDVIIHVRGRMRALLTGERTALNFLQRLSGIATHVRTFLGTLESSSVRLVDTRKTTPGLRTLEKYAVRTGGAHNHRMGLFDGVLIKDNHILACGGIRQAVEAVRRRAHHLLKIEVEVSDREQLRQALDAGADVIMLDNMDLKGIEQAVALINGAAAVEVSGGITRQNINQLVQAGVDIVSVGAMIHAARSVDISMTIE